MATNIDWPSIKTTDELLDRLLDPKITPPNLVLGSDGTICLLADYPLKSTHPIDSIESIQEIVGKDIELVPTKRLDYTMIVNGEGKMMQQPFSVIGSLLNLYGADVVGTIIFCEDSFLYED